MRITQNQFYKLALTGTTKHARASFEAQERIASGQRILRPSDDPSGTRRALFLQSSLERISKFTANLDDTKRFLDTGASALNQISELISQIRSAAVAGNNGTATQEDRDINAQQIDALRAQLISLTNTEFQGQFLFAGTENGQIPFVVDADTVSYRGNAEEIRSAVGPGLNIRLDVPGSEAFQSRTPFEARFFGRTGVAAGASMSSLTSDALLLLGHTATVVGDGLLAGGGDSASGLVPGASSAAGDTILGGHQLELTVAADGLTGTVSFGGGTPIAFDTGDTDLRIEKPNGDAIYLDFSSVTAGFTGPVTLDAQGTYSLDGGTTTVAIDFLSDDQPLTDPSTGKILQVDGRDVERVGESRILFTGGLDLFQSISALRDDLRNDSGLDQGDLSDRVLAHLDELDRHLNIVLNRMSELGSRSASLDSVRSFLDGQDLSLQDTLATTLDTDITETVINLARSQALLDATAAVSNRVLSLSLGGFLG